MPRNLHEASFVVNTMRPLALAVDARQAAPARTEGPVRERGLSRPTRPGCIRRSAASPAAGLDSGGGRAPLRHVDAAAPAGRGGHVEPHVHHAGQAERGVRGRRVSAYRAAEALESVVAPRRGGASGSSSAPTRTALHVREPASVRWLRSATFRVAVRTFRNRPFLPRSAVEVRNREQPSARPSRQPGLQSAGVFLRVGVCFGFGFGLFGVGLCSGFGIDLFGS